MRTSSDPVPEAPERPRSTRVVHAVGEAGARAGLAVVAAGSVVVWIGVGFASGFASWWATVLYATSSCVTLVMVFAIHHTQARLATVTQRKLDELLRAAPDADNRYIAAEQGVDAEIDALVESHQDDVAAIGERS